MSLTHVFDQDLRLVPGPVVTPIVFVVDDDAAVRHSLESLIRRHGWRPQTFACAQEFLNHPRALGPSCLVLDLSVPGAHGIEQQKRIAAERIDMPIISVTTEGDVPTTVQAMKAGALESLTKPFDDEELLNAIREALDRSSVALAHEGKMQMVRDCYASLTRREREVMGLVVCGLLNKQVGSELGISEITVKAHRGQVMKKMKANSLADLVKIAERLGLAAAPKDCSPARGILSEKPFVVHSPSKPVARPLTPTP